MIAYISGKIVWVGDSTVIIKPPSGIGYLINVKQNHELMVNEQIDLFLYHVVREDREELYGFERLEEKEWLEKLLKVSGVGPKMAATIVNSLSVDNIQKAIISTDSSILSQVKGLGPKTAKKIVLELKGSITDLHKLDDETKSTGSQTAVEFTETLSNLGFKRGNIVSAISQMKKDGSWDESDLVSMVKKGLKIVGKK